MYIGNQNDERRQENLDDSPRGIQAENQSNVDSIEHSEVGSDSSTEPNESERADRTVGQRTGRGGKSSNIGKMLRQLRTIKEAHLAYVKAHEQRLENRLDENRKHQQQIFSEIEQLEDELTQLLAEFDEPTESE